LNASASNKKPKIAENCGSIFLAAAPLSFLIQLGDVRRDPPRLVADRPTGRKMPILLAVLFSR
jgi:hypothetical protein